MDRTKILDKAKETLDIEIEGLQKIRDELGDDFCKVVEACEQTLREGGKLVLTGIGKSAHISRKIAASLMSTGSPAAFLYPVESMHGDLGMLSMNDLIIAVSYSGETNELLTALPFMKNLGHKILAVTGNPDSRLGKMSDYILPMKIQKEACPYNLAPTTSTTALLALGDALTLVLMHLHSFSKLDYGRLHPSGAIGRSLTFKAKDIMHTYPTAPVIKDSHWRDREDVIDVLLKSQSPILIVEDKGEYIELHKAEEFTRNGEWNEAGKKVLTVFEDVLAVEVLEAMNAEKTDCAVILSKEKTFAGVIFRDDLKSFKL